MRHNVNTAFLSIATIQEVIMAKTNFSYEKRQRELEKKKKAEEKAKRKLEAKNTPGEAGEAVDQDDDTEDAAPEAQNPG
jgi:hypothetical protein